MRGIIAGVDGSADSHRALEWAINQAAIRRVPLTDARRRHPRGRPQLAALPATASQPELTRLAGLNLDYALSVNLTTADRPRPAPRRSPAAWMIRRRRQPIEFRDLGPGCR